MAPSVIGIQKSQSPRKRQSFEGNEIPHKKRCLSDTEVSDEDSASRKSLSPQMDDDRRAHHNELERRRRDHIKDHFMALKQSIPLLEGEKSSRALILKRAVEYIAMMQERLTENQNDIARLREQNENLEAQVKALDNSQRPLFMDDKVRSPVNKAPFSVSACAVGPSISTSLLSPLSTPSIGITSTSTVNTLALSTELGSPQSQLQALTSVPPSGILGTETSLPDTILRAVSNPLLNISSLFLASSPIKLNQPVQIMPTVTGTQNEFDYPNDVHSRILANSFAVDRPFATATVRF